MWTWVTAVNDEFRLLVTVVVFVTGGHDGLVCLQIPPGKLVRLMTVMSWNIRDGTKVTPFVNQVNGLLRPAILVVTNEQEVPHM